MITATRRDEDVEVGCSPRATIALMKGSQAYAAINGRDYVIPEDVKEMAIPILSHRLILKNDSGVLENMGQNVVTKIANSINPPLEQV